MKTWSEYKEYVKGTDATGRKDIEEIESIAEIVSAIVKQRNALGISQRKLATMCGIPQSSVARIESYKTIPNLNTLLKILQPLGIRLTVSLPKQNALKVSDNTIEYKIE